MKFKFIDKRELRELLKKSIAIVICSLINLFFISVHILLMRFTDIETKGFIFLSSINILITLGYLIKNNILSITTRLKSPQISIFRKIILLAICFYIVKDGAPFIYRWILELYPTQEFIKETIISSSNFTHKFLVLGIGTCGITLGCVLFLCAALYVVDWLLYSIVPREVESDTHGSAKWASSDDNASIINCKNLGLVIDGKNKIKEALSFQNCAVVAPSGFGKTQSFVIPNLFYSNNRSFVVTDPSGEIFKKTSAYMESRGFEVVVIRPFSEETNFYNPLQDVKNLSQAKIVSDTIIGQTESKDNPFWHTSASKLLSGLIILTKNISRETKNNFSSIKNIKRILSLSESDFNELIDKGFNENVRIEVANYVRSSENTRSGITMTLDSALSIFSDENFDRITSSHDINFSDLRKKQTIMYLVIPEHKIKYSSPFLSLFYKQMFEYLLENSDGLPVYVIMDEFGNMGYIPDFPNIITTARKRKISISMVIQEVEQVKSLYKKDFHTIFHGGCVSKIFYPGLGLETCKHISETIGNKTTRTTSTSTSGSSESSYSRPLIMPDEVRRLGTNKIIFLTSNLRPFKMKNLPAYENEEIKLKLTEFEGTTANIRKPTIKKTSEMKV